MEWWQYLVSAIMVLFGLFTILVIWVTLSEHHEREKEFYETLDRIDRNLDILEQYRSGKRN